MRRVSGLFLILALAFLPVAAARAGAAPAKPRLPAFQPIVLTYDIYVGGVHFVTADILFQEQKGKYRSKVEARTYGFWHKMLPWDTVLQSEGRIAGDRFVPSEFYTRDVWRNKPKVTKLHFDARGGVTPEFDPPETVKPPDAVTLKERHGSLDPVTALVQMLAHVAARGDCDVTVPVFDGKRRFDVTGSDSESEDIDEDGYGVYKGKARTCDASFTMIGGDWTDRKPTRFWQKNDKEMGREPFHIWLGSVAPGLPEMPVRLESGSVFGLIVLHLSGWHYASAAEMKP